MATKFAKALKKFPTYERVVANIKNIEKCFHKTYGVPLAPLPDILAGVKRIEEIGIDFGMAARIIATAKEVVLCHDEGNARILRKEIDKLKYEFKNAGVEFLNE